MLAGTTTQTARWYRGPHASADFLALVFLLFQLLGACAIAVTPVVANELTETYGLTGSQIGLLSSLFLMMFCVGGIPMGMAATRWGGRALFVGVVLMLVGFVVFAFSDSYSWFLIARLLQGLGASAGIPTANTMLGRHVPASGQNRALGIFGSGVGLGYLFGLAVLPSIENAGGYTTVFLTLAGVAVLVGIVASLHPGMRAQPDSTAAETSLSAVTRGLGRAALDPRLWVIAVVNIGGSATAVTLIAWTPSFLEKQFGASLALAAYLTAGMAVAQLLGNLLGAVAMGRWSKIAVVFVSLVGMIVLSAVLPTIPVLVLSCAIVIVCGFFSMSMFPAVIAIVPEVVDRPDQVGGATGFVFLFNVIGMMIPPWLFGKLLDVYGTGPEQSGYLGGYLMLAAFPLASLIATVVFVFMKKSGTAAKA